MKFAFRSAPLLAVLAFAAVPARTEEQAAPVAIVEPAAPPAVATPAQEEAFAASPAGAEIRAEPANAETAAEPASSASEPAPAAPVLSAEQPAPAAPEIAAEPAAAAAPRAAEAAPAAAPEAVAAEPAAPDPVRIALKDAVERIAAAPVARHAAGQTPSAALRREREAIAAHYAARDFAPLWIAGNSFTPAARAALARIERAREDGLDLAQYQPPTLGGVSPEAMANAELSLSQAVVGYARQAGGVRIEPRSIGLITSRPEVASPESVLANVSASADAGAALLAYNPPHPGYRALRDKLGEVRRERPAVAAPRIGPGPILKVGMKDPRVPLVRARFGIDASADKPDGELVYDTRVASAVADFQRANGLPANGALTARTIAALSGGDPSRLESEILANMERWRWAPREMGETRIEVNIPDYRARLVRDGKVAHSMRVIVGKPETPTPVFSDTMEFMVVNPSWHVPQSIIRKQLAQDPSYYARNGYEVVRRGNNIFVRQPPGERNALGNIKFMFPNDHAVYMHDTPNRNLFNAARRAYSHGCVRVDQPFRFAEALAEETGWSEQRLRGLLGRGERTIRLNAGVPVHIMYFTAYVDEEGKMQLRDDLYGHSRKVQAALGL
jgi:murein L,D-transpeptidase YcbB/YkuD